MADLTWGGKLAVDHDEAFVQLEVPSEGGTSVITLDPDVARRVGYALIVHAEALLPQEATIRARPRTGLDVVADAARRLSEPR